VSVFGAALLYLLSQCCEDGVTYYSRPDVPPRATEDADQRGNEQGEEQDCKDNVDFYLCFHSYFLLFLILSGFYSLVDKFYNFDSKTRQRP
jgi:hypothetical protein